MGYNALSAFLSVDDDMEINPERDAKEFAAQFVGKTAEEIEAILLPICGNLAAYIEKVGVHPKDMKATAEKSMLARNGELTAALKPFANIPPSSSDPACYWVVNGSPEKWHFSREDLLRAKAVLEPIKGEAE